MGIRFYKPTTPGRRGASVSDFAEITDRKKRPEKSLTVRKKKTGGRVAAHEIIHGTEQQTPSVLKKSRAFLKRRAGGKPTVSLRKATGQNYKAHERAWEDDWIAKGGRLYMGKDYGDRATEILTMGIERLHRNLQEFAMNDSDFPIRN